MLPGLTAEQCRAMENQLSDLLVRSESEAVFLCNRGGYILAASAVEDYEHDDNIAALAAGSFYATREIASMVGEPEFRYVFHQGDKKSIFMQTTAMDLLLVVVFGESSNPGLVRLCADEMSAGLEEEFKAASDRKSLRAALEETDISIRPDGTFFKVVDASGHSET